MFIIIHGGEPIDSSLIKERAIKLAGQKKGRLFEVDPVTGIKEIKIEPLLFKVVKWFEGAKTSEIISQNMCMSDTQAYLNDNFYNKYYFEKLIQVTPDKITLVSGDTKLHLKFIATEWEEVDA